jgi:hypothetical protein
MGEYDCKKDSDCIFLFSDCCQPLNVCLRYPTEVVNKQNKENVKKELVSKCVRGGACPFSKESTCSSCLNIEDISPICLKEKCSIEKKINCENYCQALRKDKKNECPLISDEKLITEENTQFCKCPKDVKPLSTPKATPISDSAKAALARDEQRKMDLENIALALEKYKKTNGKFPDISKNICSSDIVGCSNLSWKTALLDIDKGVGVITLPIDPINDKKYFYRLKSLSSPSSFCITVNKLESEPSGWYVSQSGSGKILEGLINCPK